MNAGCATSDLRLIHISVRLAKTTPASRHLQAIAEVKSQNVVQQVHVTGDIGRWQNYIKYDADGKGCGDGEATHDFLLMI